MAGRARLPRDRPPPGAEPRPQPGLGPMRGFERPLVLTTMRWFSAARLAHSLLRAGFAVSACRPRGHPMEAVDGIAETHHLNRLWRQRSLLAPSARLDPTSSFPTTSARCRCFGDCTPTSGTDDPDIAELIAHSLGSRLVDDHLAHRVRTEARADDDRGAGDGTDRRPRRARGLGGRQKPIPSC